MSNIRFYAVEDGLALETPYEPAFIDAFKTTVPYQDRRWDKMNRRWIISEQHASHVADLVYRMLGTTLTVPQVETRASITVQGIKVYYLGRCKLREDSTSEATAFGCDDPYGKRWPFVFSESVLQRWFDDQREQSKPQTLYAVLGIKQSATVDELKSAYRRMARQWHPDLCKEPDARDQFERIQHAYEILSDETSRKKYDVGLAFEASTHEQHDRPKNFLYRRHDAEVYGYRAPLLNGMLLVEGTQRIGKLFVSNILKWDDIVDNQGRTMISSWSIEEQRVVIHWG